jgi:hypothetical protein
VGKLEQILEKQRKNPKKSEKRWENSRRFRKTGENLRKTGGKN